VKSTKSPFQSLVKAALAAGRSTQKVGRLLRPIIRPIGGFFRGTFDGLIRLFVPFYRIGFRLRRSLLRFYKPAQSTVLFWLTNRFIVHAVIALLTLVALVSQFRVDAVRAENFGQRSLMYAIVSEQSNLLVEEYALIDEDEDYVPIVYSYQDRDFLTAENYGRGVSSDPITTQQLINQDALASSSGRESSGSIAPRTEILTYTVQTGDTLSSIAEEFGISLNTLLWANDLSVRSTIRPGSELTILPVSGVLYTVRSGDTLSRISAQYDVAQSEILDFNGISGSTLSIGEQLILPGGSPQASRPVTTTASVVSSAPSPSPSTAAPSSARMVWPTDLRVITQYYGWNHTGIDIDCHFTNDNYAADAGVVTYVGWKGGYGYTVEIDHGGGLMTRYGHHASMYVRTGQSVSRGQAIGRCGTTGRSTGTHLHFEVIAGGRYESMPMRLPYRP
jgi:murein DD-endopeptidase MepM/ murein hydrolase activator NlpD